MEFRVGSSYYIVFLDSSKPDVPTIENLKRKYPNIYAFPVAGSIDGIVISEEKLPICDKRYTLEMVLVDKSKEFPLEKKHDYAFLHFESNLEPKQITHVINKVNEELEKESEETKIGIKNYMIFKSKNDNKYLLFVRYNGNISLDKLWSLIYEYAKGHGGVRNDNTYVVFTTEFAKRDITPLKAYA